MRFIDLVQKYGNMILSQTGVIADILWHEIPHHAQFVELGDFVIMPNHIHGILILNKPVTTNPNDIQTGDTVDTVETGHALFLQTNNPPTPKTIGQQRFQNIGKNSISAIIGSYKSAVTKHANRLGLKNGWQVRFHDHIY